MGLLLGGFLKEERIVLPQVKNNTCASPKQMIVKAIARIV
jgi:hypothetical protein